MKNNNKSKDFNLNEKNDAYDSINVANILAENLKNFIFSEQKYEKNSYGIYGDWGIGKSTIFNYLKNKKIEELGFRIIIIELWKYELFENDLFKITEEILKNVFEKYYDNEMIKKAFIKAWNHFATTANFATTVANKLTLGVIPKLNFPKLEKRIETTTNILGMLKLESSLINFEKKDMENKNSKILIIFDEIDRCTDFNIEKYLNYIKHIIINLSDHIKTAIVMDYDYVSSLLFKEKNSDRANKFFRKIIGESFKIEDYLKLKKINESDKFIYEKVFEILSNSDFFSARWRNSLIENVENKFIIFHKYFDNILNKNEKCYDFWKNIILVFLIFKEFIITVNNKNIKKVLYFPIINNIKKVINILQDQNINEDYVKLLKYFDLDDKFYISDSYINKMTALYLKNINTKIKELNNNFFVSYNDSKLYFEKIDFQIMKTFLEDNKEYFINKVSLNYVNHKNIESNSMPWIQICFFGSEAEIQYPSEQIEKDIKENKIYDMANWDQIKDYAVPIQRNMSFYSNDYSHLELQNIATIQRENLKKLFNFFGSISVNFNFSHFLINNEDSLIKQINKVFPNILVHIFSVYQELNVFKEINTEFKEMSNWLEIMKWFYNFL